MRDLLRETITINGVVHRARKSGWSTFWVLEQLPLLRPGDRLEHNGTVYRVVDHHSTLVGTKIVGAR